MAERLAEDLWRLDIPLVGNPLKNLNSYLLTGERSLLIDTGFRQQSCREAMERQLAETHVDRDRLDIFCTHLHSDHTGLAPELIRPGCRIYIGEIDSPGVKNASDPSCWKRLYGEYVRDGFTYIPMDFAKTLFRKSILDMKENMEIIDQFTANWELDRISEMDKLIMDIAIAELKYFPSIPVKVTLDEFIEISKNYCSPKSSSFINGVLDKVVILLKEKNQIKKIGRGLME